MNPKTKLHLRAISVLVLTVTLLLATIPTPRAENISTVADILVTPDPAGLSRILQINGTVTPAPPEGYFYVDIDFILTQPDGREIVLGPYISDANGTVCANFVPEQCGTYVVGFKLNEQTINGDLYLESNFAPTEFVVLLDVPEDDNIEPVAFFTFSPASASINETVVFDASASIDPDGSITDYFWDFGDGTTGTGQTAAHSYDSNSSYTVVLTVTDDGGLTDVTTRTINDAIPEFPSSIILPLIAITALILVFYKKRLPRHL
ncbi:MAG: hypothetical protein CW691_05535 [Candidatus Bathyarchaeum sp.]|nr:MAG: hypothetical protein CW691_05535 [Candidatus Bathyarchaeum sp.]